MSKLAVQQIAKSYRGRDVVKGVSLQLSSGEVVGLLGPNGAGKTTSFYMIVGLITPDAGKIMLDDMDITQLPMHARAQHGIGYLPQEASVFRKLSVTDNIMAILQTRKYLNPTQREHALEELLEELHIGHIRANMGMSLSGGERRRVEIARALATNPRFILLDEPFAGVDPISVLDIQSIINHLQERNIGVLITDHNVRDTLEITHRSYIINLGEIVVSGTKEELLESEVARKIYLGQEFEM